MNHSTGKKRKTVERQPTHNALLASSRRNEYAHAEEPRIDEQLSIPDSTINGAKVASYHHVFELRSAT